MPPKADEAFCGVVAPARVREIQCHFAGHSFFLLVVPTFLACVWRGQKLRDARRSTLCYFNLAPNFLPNGMGSL